MPPGPGYTYVEPCSAGVYRLSHREKALIMGSGPELDGARPGNGSCVPLSKHSGLAAAKLRLQEAVDPGQGTHLAGQQE